MDGFGRSKSSAEARTVKSWVVNALGLGSDATVMVSELRCHEPGCPPLETVIVILSGADERREVRLHKGLAAIEQSEVEVLLGEPPGS